MTDRNFPVPTDTVTTWEVDGGRLVMSAFLDFDSGVEFEFTTERVDGPNLEWTCRDTEVLQASSPQEVFDLMVECDADLVENRKGWAWRQLRLMDLGLAR